jgi:hypothetical protein
MVSGLLFVPRLKVIVTPAGMLTVVKLKTPLSGTVIVCVVAGLNAPSAPVEPLLKLFCPCATTALNSNGKIRAWSTSPNLLLKSFDR